MNSDSISLQIIDGIYDIHPIVKPEHSLVEATLMSFIVFFIISLSIYIAWNVFFSKKSISKRKIKILKSQHINKEISLHDTAYELCLILRNGLGIKNIDTKIQLPLQLTSNKIKWDRFVEEIDLLRYKDTSSTTNIETLFDESLFWLKAWP